MEWDKIILKARIIREEFLKSHKCLNIDRDIKKETLHKHINCLIKSLEKLRVLFNVNYSRLTQGHKAAAESFFLDTREKLITVALRKGIQLNLPTSIHEEISFTPLEEKPDEKPENKNLIMPQTVVEFLNSASRLIPDFDGTADNLQSFIDALSLVDSIKETHDAVAVSLVKTKLKGSARNLISTETTLQEIITKLRQSIKGESVDVVIAKLMNVRQQGKTANTYAKEIEDLTKKLETAYINDGLPSHVATTYATRSATKAIIKNASNERVKLIMESGSFNTLNETIAKFISSCTEAYGQPNSILAFSPNPQNSFTQNRNQNRRRGNNINTYPSYNANSNSNNNGYNYQNTANRGRNRYTNFNNNGNNNRNNYFNNNNRNNNRNNNGNNNNGNYSNGNNRTNHNIRHATDNNSGNEQNPQSIQ